MNHRCLQPFAIPTGVARDVERNAVDESRLSSSENKSLAGVVESGCDSVDGCPQCVVDRFIVLAVPFATQQVDLD